MASTVVQDGSLGDKDLFVVQLQDSVKHDPSNIDEIVSVRFETMRDSMVQMAVAGTAPDYDDGLAGIAYPGRGFYYDPNTGQMDLKVESDLTFVDVLLREPISGGADKVWDTTEGATKRGNFYIIGETDIELDTNIWSVARGDATTNLGDLVICVEDSVDGASGYMTHEWNIIPNVTGGQAVLSLNTGATNTSEMSDDKEHYTDVITDGTTGTPQRPFIRIRKAGVVENADSNIGTEYFGGLIDEEDKEKLDKFDLNLFEEGWVRSLVLDGDSVTAQALDLDRDESRKGPEYPDLTLTANKATIGSFGVTELANQSHIDEVIEGPLTSGRVNDVVMTPKDVQTNYVPRLFSTLPNLETGRP